MAKKTKVTASVRILSEAGKGSASTYCHPPSFAGVRARPRSCGIRQCRSILTRVAGPEDFEGFEWDEEKSARCYEDRGFDFHYAAKLFDGDFIEWEDRRRDWGEPRVISVGEVEGRILSVVWTPRSTVRRIISARPASRSEREQLYEHRQAQQQRDS